MGTAFLVILCLLFLFIYWIRYQWRRDPMKILRMLFRIPDPDKGHKKKKTGKNSNTSGGNHSQGYDRRHRFRHGGYDSDSVIPKEYAEDVEFVEIKEFGTREDTAGSKNGTYRESQVSDAEWVEIKHGDERKSR